MGKLEGPGLSIKTMKSSPISSLKKIIREDAHSLMVGMDDGLEVPLETSSWITITEKDFSNLDVFPDALCNIVILNEVLECFDLEKSRKIIAECKRITKNNGMVVALSRACHHGEELYELVSKTSMKMDKFYNRRLSNQRIANLRPNEAMFFRDMVNVPNRKRLYHLMGEMGIEADLEKMWGFPEKLAINKFYVCMKWSVNR